MRRGRFVKLLVVIVAFPASATYPHVAMRGCEMWRRLRAWVFPAKLAQASEFADTLAYQST